MVLVLQLAVDDVLHLLPHALHLAPVEDAAGQRHQGERDQGHHHAQPHVQDNLHTTVYQFIMDLC